MKSYEIRKGFLDFFAKNGHPVVASGPLIPQGDPSLLFTSAGMVQFKPYYLGLKTDMKRAASSQKCFRTTDIDNVGKTIRHLTFFEMLGNFSFGDYFKEESLKWGYEFLVKEMSLNPEKLYFSIYKGGVAPKDEEAARIWEKILPAGLHSHIFEMGEDNFWAMGDTGPCGPCSEIYYDRGEQFSHKGCSGPGCSCDRYIEIWNHVFTQFDKQADGTLRPLPKKNIDTGMGLERLAFVVEGKYSPFETSLFYPVIEGFLNLNPSVKYDGNSPEAGGFRIISDHLRGAAFLISEGVIPSNEGRGYVLRRLIRRAERFGMIMGVRDSFLHKLVDLVIGIFKDQYPQLRKNREHIISALRYEEDGFLETLANGEKYLNELMERSSGVINGREAFSLYETYGFPFELTREIALKNGLKADEDGFLAARKEAQDTAKGAWKSSGEKDAFLFQKAEEKLSETEFTGYEKTEDSGRLTGIVSAEGALLDSAQSGECWLVFDKTPFYAESGGQLADTGAVFEGEKRIAEVLDVQKPVGKVFYHKARLNAPVKKGVPLRLVVDGLKRKKTAANHTATHLLNAALKKVFGENTRQAGSLVSDEKFRFDYTVSKTPEWTEILEVERIANEAARAGYRVFKRVRPLADADSLGATVLPGEKYSDPARFILINGGGFEKAKDRYSLELCGGTHVDDLRDVFFLKITRESSLSRGVRRIEGVAGYAAVEYVGGRAESLESLMSEFSADKPENLAVLINKYKSEIKALRDEMRKIKTGSAGLSGGKREEFPIKGGVTLISEEISDPDVKILRALSDKLRNETRNSLIFLYSLKDGKINFTLSLSSDLKDPSFDASAEARKISGLFEGRAGGRKDFAQGGGVLKEDIKSVKNKIVAMLK